MFFNNNLINYYLILLELIFNFVWIRIIPLYSMIYVCFLILIFLFLFFIKIDPFFYLV